MIRRLLWLLAVLTVLSAGVVTTGCEYDRSRLRAVCPGLQHLRVAFGLAGAVWLAFVPPLSSVQAACGGALCLAPLVWAVAKSRRAPANVIQMPVQLRRCA